MTAPLCACHGEPSRWNTDKRYRGGGYWRCAVKDRAQTSRYVSERRERDPLWRIARDIARDKRCRRRYRRAASPVPVNPKIADALRAVKRRS